MPVDPNAAPADEFPDWANACLCGKPLPEGRELCDECRAKYGDDASRVTLSGGGEPVRSMPLCVCGAEAYLSAQGWRCTVSDELADVCPLGET